MDHTLWLVELIQEVAEAYSKGASSGRSKLLELSYALAASVELPSEAIQRIGWAEPARSALCKLAIDLHLFDTLAAHEGQSLSPAHLASLTGADETLLSRTLKHLAATHTIRETGPDQYTANTLTKAFTQPQYRDGLLYTYDVAGPSFRQLPAYLASTGYAHPTSISAGPFQYAHKTELPFFEWLASNPPYGERFNNYMGGYRAGKRSWVDARGYSYPFAERVVGGAEEEGVVLVDVGGGMGHDLAELVEKVPALRGRVVLQDRASVVEQIGEKGEGKKGFEVMAHDFFEEQPVRGARAYFLHSVLHDWDDEMCGRILGRIVPAMRRGYSKVLVNELVIPDEMAGWAATSMDWLMMALGAVKERTEKDWRALLEGAGLRVVYVFTFEPGTESLIECELA